MKLKHLLFPILSVMVMSSYSCKKESTPAPATPTTPTPTTPTADANETTNNALQGTWTVSSFVTAGVEVIGGATGYKSMKFSFQKEDKNDGSMIYEAITAANANEYEKSKYTIRNNGKELTDGSGSTFNVTVSGSNLTLEGSFNSLVVKITAKK